MKTLSAICLFLLAGAMNLMAKPAWAQQAVGDWHGELIVGAARLRVGVSITPAADGNLVGMLVTPDQSSRSFALDQITISGASLSFGVPAMQGRFTATWDSGRQGWAGTWTQESPAPLILLPGKVASLSRPQQPRPPFPYRSEEATIQSVPGVTLACTLTLPQGRGSFPAALLISGSGAQNRDEEVFEHKPFLVIADDLTRRGIAVLRCDDRGTGSSTGQFAGAAIPDFAVDAASAVAWLRRHDGINPRQVGVVGHSEGGIVAAMIAQKDPAIAFVVQLAAPGLGGYELSLASVEALGRASGASPQTIASTVAIQKRMLDTVAQAANLERAKAAVELLLRQAGAPADQIEAQTRRVDAELFYFLNYDPKPALESLRMPLLALAGSTDPIVPAARNLPIVRAATINNPDTTIVELSGLNHLFQASPTGLPADYGKINETFSPDALKLMGDWISKRTASGK